MVSQADVDAIRDAGRSRLSRTILRAGRIMLGVLCLVLGVIGLFLPFLQGILLLLIGLSLLSSESERARRWLAWLRAYADRKRIPGVGT